MKLKHSLIPYIKINSKWIKDLNVRPGIKIPREKHSHNTDINCSNIFLDSSKVMKNLKNKRDLITVKSFCIAETFQKTTKKDKI